MGFRTHVAAYVAVDLFLVGVWFVTSRESDYWPLWVQLGWGIGLVMDWWHVHGGGPDAVAREEQRLRERHGGAP